MEKILIKQGAEAKLFLDKHKKTITKERIKKSYRITELDEKIRKRRTRSEAKLLQKASKIISAPKVIETNESEKTITYKYIDGKPLSQTLENYSEKKQLEILKRIGKMVKLLHENDIIHGDLTTSNMIFNEKTDDISIIDFGLGYISSKIEDRAIDIHLLKQALEAKHYSNWEKLYQKFIEGYQPYSKSNLVLNQIKKVEKRGRYRH